MNATRSFSQEYTVTYLDSSFMSSEARASTSRDDGSMTTFNDTTVDVFLDMSYIPDETLSQMTQVGQEYRDTVRGQALCDHVRMSGNEITFDAWLYHGTSSVAYLEIELVENGTTQRSSVAFDTSLLDEI